MEAVSGNEVSLSALSPCPPSAAAPLLTPSFQPHWITRSPRKSLGCSLETHLCIRYFLLLEGLLSQEVLLKLEEPSRHDVPMLAPPWTESGAAPLHCPSLGSTEDLTAGLSSSVHTCISARLWTSPRQGRILFQSTLYAQLTAGHRVRSDES